MNIEDQRNATGRGIMLITKKGLVVEKIFPKINDDRLLIAKVKYETNKELILGGFHLNQLKKKQDVERFLNVLKQLYLSYVDTDIIFYTDLNMHPETKKFRHFQEELLKINYNIMIPKEYTRKGGDK